MQEAHWMRCSPLIFALFLFSFFHSCRTASEPTEQGDFPLPCPTGWAEEEVLRCEPLEDTIATLGSDGRGGVAGVVSRIEGDCQPVTIPGDCIESRDKRRVVVRQLLTFDDIEHESESCNGLCLSFSESTLVEEVNTTEYGEFLVNLEPGNYSVFIRNSGCDQCQNIVGDALCPVEVTEGNYTVVLLYLDCAYW